ncbi:hypothetical protein [Streptomyces sp. NPDC058632]|uniref:hypothetical protein n=1 Tax=unclassified Streptomyces TaxID=2593676 RepID=UPI00366A02A9
MFAQLRTPHPVQWMRAVDAVHGTDRQPDRITTHDAPDFATLPGARTNSLGDVTGSLTPGVKADQLVVGAEDLTNMPLNDPIGTVVPGSQFHPRLNRYRREHHSPGGPHRSDGRAAGLARHRFLVVARLRSSPAVALRSLCASGTALPAPSCTGRDGRRSGPDGARTQRGAAQAVGIPDGRISPLS